MKKGDPKKFYNREAAEQTLLSWIQTGLTLIGFGFGLGSIIALMRAEHYEKFIVKSIRIIAALLVLVGILSITLALIEHKRKIKHIKNKKIDYQSSFNLSSVVGIMVSFLGMLAFLVILIHLFF